MTVGDRIRKKRADFGISQKELADKIKIKPQTMYKYEMNIITNIPSDKIEEISKILNISPCYLMGWENENYSCPSTLTSSEETLLTNFRSLNDDGQQKLLERAKELQNLGYVKRESAKMA